MVLFAIIILVLLPLINPMIAIQLSIIGYSNSFVCVYKVICFYNSYINIWYLDWKGLFISKVYGIVLSVLLFTNHSNVKEIHCGISCNSIGLNGWNGKKRNSDGNEGGGEEGGGGGGKKGGGRGDSEGTSNIVNVFLINLFLTNPLFFLFITTGVVWTVRGEACSFGVCLYESFFSFLNSTILFFWSVISDFSKWIFRFLVCVFTILIMNSIK